MHRTMMILMLCCSVLLASSVARGQSYVGQKDIYRERNAATGLGFKFNAEKDRMRWECFLPSESGYLTIMSKTISGVVPGDRFRVYAQAQVTIDAPIVMGTLMRIKANGYVVGTEPSENVSGNGNHHMTMWADAIYTHNANGDLTISVEYAASRTCNGGSCPSVPLMVDGVMVGTSSSGNASASELVIEHYRSYASPAALQADGARVLWGIYGTQTPSIDMFDGDISPGDLQDNKAYVLSNVAAQQNDYVRLFAQTTSEHCPTPICDNPRVNQDAHVAQIGLDTGPNTFSYPPSNPNNYRFDVNSTAGENTGPLTYYVPLWTNATDSIASTGNRNYVAWMWTNQDPGQNRNDLVYDAGGAGGATSMGWSTGYPSRHRRAARSRISTS